MTSQPMSSVVILLNSLTASYYVSHCKTKELPKKSGDRFEETIVIFGA